MKTASSNYFRDFSLGMRLVHATPRTVTEGDVALYTALYGPRFRADERLTTARAMGLERMPLDDLLTFHVVFGKTVPDISLNAVANLGYAGGRFGVRVYQATRSRRPPGDRAQANRDGKTGVVYVRSVGVDQDGRPSSSTSGGSWSASVTSPRRRRRLSCPSCRRPSQSTISSSRTTSVGRHTTRFLAAARTCGTTTRWASGSTMSTG